MSDKNEAEQKLRDLGQILDMLEVVFRNGTEQNLGMSRGGVVQNIERCRELLEGALDTSSLSAGSEVTVQYSEEPEKKVRELNIKTLMQDTAVTQPVVDGAAEDNKKEGISSRIRILPRVRMFDD